MTNQERIQSNNAELQECIEKANALPNAGGSIDVTAEVGQTIIVEEVDAGGKPTKWRAADYQPRTHYEGEEKALFIDAVPEYSAELDAPIINVGTDLELTDGHIYRLTYNGVERECEARTFDFGDGGEPLVYLGNGSAINSILPDTGEMFLFAPIGNGIAFFAPFDSLEELPTAVSLTESLLVKIPKKFLPSSTITDDAIVYVRMEAEEAQSNNGNYTIAYSSLTAEQIEEAIDNGKTVIIKVYLISQNNYYRQFHLQECRYGYYHFAHIELEGNGSLLYSRLTVRVGSDITVTNYAISIAQ